MHGSDTKPFLTLEQVPSRLSLIASATVVVLAVVYAGTVLVLGECVTEKCEPTPVYK